MQRFPDSACTVCGCVCDDLTLHVADNRIVTAERACHLAEPWFLAQNDSISHNAEIDGQVATLDDALDHAATILLESRNPLIYGLSRSTTQAQRVAIELAEFLGATIDTTASTGHGPSIMALQQVGESTCTLGEVKQRADLIIFWGCDPVVTHPRHIERYMPRREGRTFIVVDSVETETAKFADEFIPVTTDCQWQAIQHLRMRINGIAVDASPQLDELAAKMKQCRFGIIFFGPGLTRMPLAHRTIEVLLQLVTELNDHTRFYARRLRRTGDVAGADSVLAWQTGYPFGVNFAKGYPRYNPGEFTGPEMLARDEVDAMLLVGKDWPRAPLSPEESEKQLKIALTDNPADIPLSVDVAFRTAVYGVHRPGTAYRMDEVPIPLRVILETDRPSDEEVLLGILNRVRNS